MELTITLLLFKSNYEVEGFHNSCNEGYCFLRHDAMLFGKELTIYWSDVFSIYR